MSERRTTSRVLIVAEDPLVRASLSISLVEGGHCQVIGERSYSDLDGSLLQQAELDGLLFDLGWGDPVELEFEASPHFEWISEAVELGLGVVVLVGRTAQANAAWRLGVQGVLSREAPIPQIEIALMAAAAGILTLDPLFKDQLFLAIEPDGVEGAEPLTPRELEVLQLVAQGLPNKTIASTLEVTEHTVKFHVNSILRKLGAQSRTEAATIAMRRGLLLL
jgi:DNA-binding NarL/FixJ family response regulator